MLVSSWAFVDNTFLFKNKFKQTEYVRKIFASK